MSRWLSLLCLSFIFGGCCPAFTTPLSDAEWDETLLPDTPERFRSFFDPSREGGFVTAPPDYADDLRGALLLGASTPSREIQNPTADQSIIWAASRSEGPAQALAMEHMPHLSEGVPLLVDFRNRTAPPVMGNLADLPVAFLGQTPDLPSATLVCCGLGLLAIARLRSHS